MTNLILANQKCEFTQIEEAAGIMMECHHEDARLNPNSRNQSKNNNSTLSSEQARKATRTAGTSSQAVANTNLNANPPEHVNRHRYSYCTISGHRYPECLLLPCKHCGVEGHVGINCPEIVEVRAQRRLESSRWWYDANRRK